MDSFTLSLKSDAPKIPLITEDIVKAIHMINKEKAIGFDNVSLKPLIKRHAMHLSIQEQTFY